MARGTFRRKLNNFDYNKPITLFDIRNVGSDVDRELAALASLGGGSEFGTYIFSLVAGDIDVSGFVRTLDLADLLADYITETGLSEELAAYATLSAMATAISTAVSNRPTTADVTAMIVDAVTGGEINLDGYVTDDELSFELADLVTSGSLATLLGDYVTEADLAAALGAITGIQARATVTVTTGSLADGASETLSAVLATGYRLIRVATDKAARVQVYATSAQRTADAAREVGTDPEGDHGVVLDYVTTTSVLAATLSPAADGYSLEAVPSSSIPVRVTNTSGATGTVAVTFTFQRTE